jgi:hypothetical protein
LALLLEIIIIFEILMRNKIDSRSVYRVVPYGCRTTYLANVRAALADGDAALARRLGGRGRLEVGAVLRDLATAAESDFWKKNACSEKFEFVITVFGDLINFQ